MRDPYIILGIRKDASPDEIKAAWRAQAKKVHPDRNQDDPLAVMRFTEIGRAYDVLKDAERRRRYDQAREAAIARRKDQTFMEQREQSRAEELRAKEKARAEAKLSEDEARAKAGFQVGESTEDLVSRIFGAERASARGGQRAQSGGFGYGYGGDDASGFSSGPGQSYGNDDGSTIRTSPARELLSYLMRRLTRQTQQPEKAPDLAVDAETCLEDMLAGKPAIATLPDGKTLTLPYAAGARDGDRIRLDGQGHKIAGMKRGDVVARIRVQSHPWYHVEGDDIVTNHPVDIENAVLGCETTVETLDGPVTITVPEWTGSDGVVIIEGHGLPKEDGGRGNMIVEIRVMLWDFPDQKVIDLMRSLREGLFL